MKRRHYIFAFIAVVVLAGFFALYRANVRHEPAYKGKTAEEWAAQLPTTNLVEATDALRKLGTNAFPVLIRELRRKNTAWTRLDSWIYFHLPPFLQTYWPQPVWAHLAWDIDNAIELIITNDEHSHQLLPDFLEILKDKSNNSTRSVVFTLIAVLAKPGDTNCVPALIDGLSNQDYGLRYFAFTGLMNIGPDAKNAVPALVHIINSTNADDRKLAFRALEDIDPGSAAKYEHK